MSRRPLVSPPSESPSDAELVRALAHDRAAALGTLYDRHAGLVYGLTLSIVGNPDEAADLTQDVFVALCSGSGYDPARGTLAAYLVTMARSRAIDRVRGRSTRSRLLQRHHRDGGPEAAPLTPHDEIALRQEAGRVRGALADLPASQRQVLELAYYRDMTQAEIADALDVPLGTVKTHTRRGLLSLRRALEGLLG